MEMFAPESVEHAFRALALLRHPRQELRTQNVALLLLLLLRMVLLRVMLLLVLLLLLLRH